MPNTNQTEVDLGGSLSTDDNINKTVAALTQLQELLSAKHIPDHHQQQLPADVQHTDSFLRAQQITLQDNNVEDVAQVETSTSPEQ